MSMDVKLNNCDLETILSIEELPNKCPYCNHFVAPKYLSSFLSKADNGKDLCAIAFWACNGCSRVFGVTYNLNKLSGARRYYGYPKLVIPPLMERTEVSDDVKSVSPRFAELFTQAEQAKNEGMDELAGMGFRKALECLLKDALIHLGKDEDKVVKMKLDEAVRAFSDNPRLQKVATEARVIGNDYTHYKAKYTGYDIKMLQQLISITQHWVSMEIQTENLPPLQSNS